VCAFCQFDRHKDIILRQCSAFDTRCILIKGDAPGKLIAEEILNFAV